MEVLINMKIEMGESLILSWLKHAKNCQLVQTNWKPSTQSWEYYNDMLIEDIISKSQEFYLSSKDYDLFRKNSSVNQILQQGEIDVLGIEFLKSSISNLYAVEVAFHENGLNYGSKKETIERVLKKLIRMACSILGYFDIKRAEIIFAAPKINKAIYLELSKDVEELNTYINNNWNVDFNFKLICNEDFERKIFDVISTLSSNIADTSELFMRSIQMYNLFKKIINREVKKPSENTHNVRARKNDMKSNMNNEDIKSSYSEIKVGILVINTFPQIAQNNFLDEDEIIRLQSPDYSKDRFDLNYPMLKILDWKKSIKENRMVGNYPRYYANPVKINEKNYLLTNDWYERNKEYYIEWLEKIRN